MEAAYYIQRHHRHNPNDEQCISVVVKHIKAPVDIQIYGKKCEDNCSGQGICNHEFGQCRCFHGFIGDGCSERLELACNHPATEELPYCRWVVSICSAHCVITRAMCFCGQGTKYPNRPVAETCGFQVILPSEPGAPKDVNWSKANHDNIFTTNGSMPGWCNVDPAEAYALKLFGPILQRLRQEDVKFCICY